MARVRAALLALLVAAVTSSCGGGDGARPQERSLHALGGALPTATPPRITMDDLEKPIAERLAAEVKPQGLQLQVLDCPRWDGKVPARLTCRGWFDGVPGRVEVALSRDKQGMVTFDAELRGGVVATANLVDDLERKGYSDVDCGEAPAYPAEVGVEITCAVSTRDTRKYVVATVTDTRGGMTIGDL